MAKRMRLPNGFGQITKIKNKRLRNPYRVMITVGKNEEGKPICKLLKPQAYFKTYNDAYTALLEHHKNPHSSKDEISMKELYERWSNKYFDTITKQAATTINAAWRYCSPVYDVAVVDVRIFHIKECMENPNIPRTIRPRVKSLFNQLLDYAVEYDITDRNYARSYKYQDDSKSSDIHTCFTDEEMESLWNKLYITPHVDTVLIQCYTGLRPQELGLIKISNVNLEEDTIICGMKTESGTDRVVPIHPKIKALVEHKYKQATSVGSEYLITSTSGIFTYAKYRYAFKKIFDNHKCHDPRVHFITMAKKYSVDEYAIKYIVGHAITDLTEKTYTKRDVDWLKSEISKIK